MRFSGVLILFLSVCILPGNSQVPGDTHGTGGDLYLNFRNISFIKDNEYSNPVIEGYTLLGYFLQPELVYLPSEKLTLSLGGNLLSYSGTNKFTRIKPVFSAVLNLSDSATLTLGSLHGSDSHGLSDPHFNKERLYNEYSEDGAQLTVSGEHFFTDTWLSWENFIFRGDNKREIFTAGESFRYSSPSVGDILRLDIPVQIFAKHFGGQISNYPEQVETYLNLSAGASATIDLAEETYGTLGIGYQYFNGRSLTRNAPSGINSGYGHWFKLFYNFRIAGIEAGYWRSHDFYAPEGNYIFGSVSDHIEGLVIPDRRLVTGSVFLKIRPERLFSIYFGFDGYYDTDLDRLDYAITLHLRFNQFIRITNIH
jgi:hypothetical protein